jgi:hypothetical protein
MNGLEYHHIGHDPSTGEIALWSLDDRDAIHEDRRRFAQDDLEWLHWSHEQVFREIHWKAVGRVELDRKAGSIHVSDPRIGHSPTRLARLVETLEAKYPNVRWFVFGSGYRGESVMAALAGRVAADECFEGEKPIPNVQTSSPSKRRRGPTPEIKLRRATAKRS